MTDWASSISFAPLLPWSSIAAMAAAAALLLAFGAVRRTRGIAWRGLAMSVLLLMFANPSLVQENRAPLKDVAVIVVDESASQGIGERTARTEAALAALEGELSGLANLEFRVLRTAGASSDRTPDAPDNNQLAGDGSRLFAPLQDMLADTPKRRIAGAILLTDGQVHDAPEGANEILGGAPLHVLLSGRKEEKDRRLVIEQAPAYGIVGNEIELTVRVEDHGEDIVPGPATLRVSTDGQPPFLYRSLVGTSQTIRLRVDHGGPNLIEITAEPVDGELTTRNNRAVVAINGVRDRLRVLLVSGEPHAGERSLRNLLKADPSVDLVHFTILRPPEKQDGTPISELSLIAFPIRELFELKLNEFDLIIFDRYRRRGVLPQTYLDNISRYVESGGAVLEAAGPSFATPLSLFRTPLSDVLPGRPTGRVFEQGYRPNVTDIGLRHPVTAALPGVRDETVLWGRWFRQIDVDAFRGDTIMSGAAEKPLLILDRVGEGRVAQLLSDHAWLWGRGFEGGGPQAELMRRVAHWLMKEPDLEEEKLSARIERGRIEITRRSLIPTDAPVRIETPSGKVSEILLQDNGQGMEHGSIEADEIGIYRLSDGTRDALAAIGPANPREFAEMHSTDARLASAVAQTNGHLSWLSETGVPGVRRTAPERDPSGDNWLGLRVNDDYIVTGISQFPLLPPLLVLILALGALMTAWYREGR